MIIKQTKYLNLGLCDPVQYSPAQKLSYHLDRPVYGNKTKGQGQENGDGRKN